MAHQGDIETLESFNDKVEELLRLSFSSQARQGIAAMLAWQEQRGWEAIHVGPNEESVKAVVLTMRFFIQNNEPISLHNMAKLYARLTVAQDLGLQCLKLRQRLNEFLDLSTNVGIEEGKLLTHRQVLDLFFYGWLAHSNDPEKARTMKFLRQTPMFPILQVDFTQILGTIMQIVRRMSIVNTDILNALKQAPGQP